MFLLALWILLSVSVSIIGLKKEIGFWNTLILSLILSPMIGLIVVVKSGPKPEPDPLKAAQLKKLKQLKKEGRISENEYEKIKARIQYN